ncbi:hypothetical protein, partial [Mycoplasmopsis anatis]
MKNFFNDLIKELKVKRPANGLIFGLLTLFLGWTGINWWYIKKNNLFYASIAITIIAIIIPTIFIFVPILSMILSIIPTVWSLANFIYGIIVIIKSFENKK